MYDRVSACMCFYMPDSINKTEDELQKAKPNKRQGITSIGLMG